MKRTSINQLDSEYNKNSQFGAELVRTVTVVLLFLVAFSATSCAKSPTISVHPRSFDLGTVRAGEIIELTTWVKNIGEKDLIATTRSMCDCILFFTDLPDTIYPGDSAIIFFSYYVPDTADTSEKSIVISSNDKKNKIIRVKINSFIKKSKLTKADSTIVLLPWQSNNPEISAENKRVLNELLPSLAKKFNFKPLPFEILTDKLFNDPLQRTKPPEELMRKWALLEGIRWIVAYQIRMLQDGNARTDFLLIDGRSEYPIVKYVVSPVDDLYDSLYTTLERIYSNYKGAMYQAFMYGMQTKWQRQRKKILGLPLPKLKLFDIHTMKEINLHSEKGKVLLIHLFGLDCEHCDEELEWMNSFAQRVPEDLKVWGISVDIGMEEDVKEFVKNKNLTYNILIPSPDESIRLDMLYGGITPQTLIVDREGVVREFIVGFNQNIVKQLEMQLNRALAE